MTGTPLPGTGRGLWFELTAACEIAPYGNVGAVVTVAARRGGRGAGRAAGNAVVIIMDRSLSMGRLGKLEVAREAVAAAIDALSGETYFAIIAGKHDAELVYPADRTLCLATPVARQSAKDLLTRLDAAGGTEIGSWLRLARQLFRQVPDAVPRAVLYTDGLDEHEPAAELDAALRACRDHFVCDVRGVGADWDPQLLRRITGALQGELAAITDLADMRADFVRLVAHAQTQLVPRVFLRFSLDRRFRLESVSQLWPTQNDLTSHRLPQDGGVTDFPLLGWGEEKREYLVTLRVEPGTPASGEIRAARVDVLAGRAGGGPLEPCAETAVLTVRWPSRRDLPLTRSSVTEAEDRVRLIKAKRAGVAAYRREDRTAALAELTTAVGLASSLGESGELELLLRLVTIDEFGVVRLRPGIAGSDLLIADVGSTSHGAAGRPEPGREFPSRMEPLAVPARHAPPGGGHRGSAPAGRPPAGGSAAGGSAAGSLPAGGPPAGGPPAGSGAAARPGLAPGMVRRECPDGHVTVGYFVLHCEASGCPHEFGGEEPGAGEAGGDDR